MTTALTTARQDIGAAIEQVLVGGNLAQLQPEQRVSYYNAVCESVGLNPLTRPFEYITLNGKLTLYARRDCTDQLRQIHGVSIRIMAREVVEDVYVVTAQAANAKGRTDESIGAVPLGNLQGEARANAMMKAETKAKRRVTLSVCGLGMLDENEVESVPGAPKWTSGTENAPPRDVVRGFDSEAAEPIINEEYTEAVDVIDAKTGEVVKREPGVTSAQNKQIHALLRDVRNQYSDAQYRKDLKKRFCKEHTNELSVREASAVIEGLLRRHAKIAPELEAQERERAAAKALPERCADGTCHRCAMCVEIDAQAAREAE